MTNLNFRYDGGRYSVGGLEADRLGSADILNREHEGLRPRLPNLFQYRQVGLRSHSDLGGTAGRESENAGKGARIVAPATIIAARTQNITNFPGSNIFVSVFKKDRSNLMQRVPRRLFAKPLARIRVQQAHSILLFVGTPSARQKNRDAATYSCIAIDLP